MEVAGDVKINDDNQGANLFLKSDDGGGVIMNNNLDVYLGAIGWDLGSTTFTIDNGDDIILTHDGNKFNLDDKVEVNGDIELQGASRKILHESSININSLTADSTLVLLTPNPTNSGGETTLLLSGKNLSYFTIPKFGA